MRRALKKITSKDSQHKGEAGLTLIECLVALVVIAITTATITPMMLFAVATRVQNQKTEQALQLAQGELDRVRLVVEQGGDYGDRLAEMGLFSVATSTASTITTVNAPTQFVASLADVTSATDARVIDTDGDGDNDFAIQLFRNEGIEVNSQTPGVTASTPVVFNIGTRVYDIRAAALASTGGLSTDEARLTFTSDEGDRNRRPLAVLYGQIAQGDRDGGLCQYWEFAGSTPTTLQCN